ncbi:MAG: ABC transporter permease [Deltaproteobacteria bacterium]|nr:ABC transporter permease [Deltaproteobacteria bacterium]
MRSRANIMMVMPAFFLLTVLYLYPMFQIGWISLTDPSPGLQNYQKIFTSSTYGKIFYQTFSMCVVVTLICLVLGYLIAYTVDHVESRRTVALMLFFILVPFWTSILIRAYSWIVILRQDGIINHFLMRLGLTSEPAVLVRNRFGVIVGMVHVMLPFMILPILSVMKGIDKQLILAARSLGASPFTIFWRIYVPLSMPGVYAGVILVFVLSLGFYITPVLLGGGKFVMLSEYIALQIQLVLKWGMGSALAILLLVMVLGLLFIFGRFIDIRKLVSGYS